LGNVQDKVDEHPDHFELGILILGKIEGEDVPGTHELVELEDEQGIHRHPEDVDDDGLQKVISI